MIARLAARPAAGRTIATITTITVVKGPHMDANASTRATGNITVTTYEPATYGMVDGGPELIRVSATETFHGDIEGTGAVQFLQVKNADGTASFVGVEHVTGTIAGRSGSFVLQESGTIAGGIVRGTWFVVPGSGTAQLRGLRGEGDFEAQLGEGAAITLDYYFE